MTSRNGSGPQRSCIACRREGDQGSFIRFVLAPDGTVVPDLGHKLPGRGAYTCQSLRCVREAATRRQFNRAFKGAVVSAPDALLLTALLQKAMEQRIGSYLSLATKAGATVSGSEAVERCLKGAPPPSLVVLATDTAAGSADKLVFLAVQRAIPLLRVLTKEQLGQYVGKESDRSAVAVVSSGFAQSLVKEFERYRNYLEEESGR